MFKAYFCLHAYKFSVKIDMHGILVKRMAKQRNGGISVANKGLTFKHTAIACNIGCMVQGISMNMSPFLFIPLKLLYGISYTQLGFMVFINFLTQFAADLYFGKHVNKHGYRPFLIGAHFSMAFGLALFAFTPWIAPNNIHTLLVISTVIFSGAAGLLEVMLSPIVNSIPCENKGSSMAFLHSFFAIGLFTVALLTTLFLYVFGNELWFVIVLVWALIPLFNAFIFIKAPLPGITSESERMKIGKLLKHPVFIIGFFAIFFGAAAELLIVQWGSSYLERGLGIVKVAGDVWGLCLFALMAGAGRIIFATAGKKLNLNNVLVFGSLISVFCYTIVAIAPYPWMVFAAFGIIGFSTSMLWPGTLLVASNKLPFTGVMIFALLAGGGDWGMAVVGQVVGYLTDFFADRAPKTAANAEQYGFKVAIAVAVVVPLLSFVFQLILKKLAPYNNDKPGNEI